MKFPETEEYIGIDVYNFKITGDVACSFTANSGSSPTHSGPMILIQKKEKEKEKT